MEYQNFGRQQRSKGANMKQASLVMLLLVGCAWLVYQIKHSRNEPDNYGGQPKLVERYRAVSLGRKGTPSGLDERDLPTSGSVHLAEAKKTNTGRDDKNSGNIDERSSTRESDDKGKGNEESPKIPVINGSQSNEKEAELLIRGPPNGVQLQMRKNTKPDGSIKDNEEVEERKTITDGDWVHSFADENGVPPEVNETEPIGGEAHRDMVHEENISNDSKESRARKSNIYEVISSSSENDIVEMTLGGSTSRDVIVDAEVNSQSTIAHVDR